MSHFLYNYFSGKVNKNFAITTTDGSTTRCELSVVYNDTIEVINGITKQKQNIVLDKICIYEII